jgi:Plasmid encoded RepA protein
VKLDNVPLIRDPDLLAELERLPKTPFSDFQIRILEQKQAKRDALKAMPPGRRRREQTADLLTIGNPTPGDLRHIHPILAICGLPYDRLPLEQREFERKHFNMALDVSAGSLRSPDGEKVLQPIPYGTKARLILTHLCSEAILQKSPTIEIAETLTGFVRDMGFPDSGGKKGPLTAFKEQLNALAACNMRLSFWGDGHVRTKSISPISEMDIWLPASPAQRTLWPSTVTFSTEMWESLRKHAMPINTHVVKAFAGSARKLDLYFWLSYRISNIDGPLTLSWKALQDQFGSNFSRERDFRARLVKEIDEIKETLRRLPVKISEQGMTITPGDPDVLALPAPKPLKRAAS